MKTFLLILMLLSHPLSAWAFTDGQDHVVELESCNDKEITLIIDDPISLDKIYQVSRPMSANITIENIQINPENKHEDLFEIFMKVQYHIDDNILGPAKKIIIQDNSNIWRSTELYPYMKDLYKLSIHKNYLEFTTTPIFRTGDKCGVKQKFNARLFLLPQKGEHNLIGTLN